MQHRKRMSSLAIVPLLAAAIAAPAATAQPIDMHGSTVQKPAAAQQDLRSEAATGASSPVSRQNQDPGQDLRSEASADTSRAPRPAAGVPTWPASPKPITPVSQQPVADVGGDGGGIDWPVSLLAIAGALLLAGSLGVAGKRYRTNHGHVTG
jgi:hypothetical protein